MLEWHKMLVVSVLTMALTWGVAMCVSTRITMAAAVTTPSVSPSYEQARLYSAAEAVAARPCLDAYWRQFDFSRAAVDWAPIYERARGSEHYGRSYTNRHDAVFNPVD